MKINYPRMALIFCLVFTATACSHVPYKTRMTGTSNGLMTRNEDRHEFQIDTNTTVKILNSGKFSSSVDDVSKLKNHSLKHEASTLKKGTGYKEAPYKVGPGDVLNIIVWDHPELTLPAGPTRSAVESGILVNEKGRIFYPYIGIHEVSKQTVDEIRRDLTYLLKRYIPKPQVNVSVAAFNSQKVHIKGSVNSLGTVPISNVPITVSDALRHIGGVDDEADLSRVVLTRGNSQISLNLIAVDNPSDNPTHMILANGDEIFVPSIAGKKAYVLGQVKTPGLLQLKNRPISLTEALTSKGGLNNQSADARGVFVLRSEPTATNAQHSSVYQLDVTQLSSYAIGTRFFIKPQDVIYVTSDPISNWNTIIRELLVGASATKTLVDIGEVYN